jgi:predicted kinase
MIVGLIRHSSLPHFALENADGVKRVIRASLVIRCDWLALLAEADTSGRKCADRQALLDGVELFREFCREQRCFDAPRPFANDHSRFIYFRKEHGDPDYAAFDDTHNTVTLMCGLPGAGKDSWIRERAAELPVVLLDGLRRELGISPEDNQGRVIAAAKERARTFLRTNTPFVWNATNTSRRLREGLIRLFYDYGARTEIVYCEAALDEIFRRNAKRETVVPARVIRRLAESLDPPDASEAHKVTYFVT